MTLLDVLWWWACINGGLLLARQVFQIGRVLADNAIGCWRDRTLLREDWKWRVAPCVLLAILLPAVALEDKP